jgi:hypothetical protein
MWSAGYQSFTVNGNDLPTDTIERLEEKFSDTRYYRRNRYIYLNSVISSILSFNGSDFGWALPCSSSLFLAMGNKLVRVRVCEHVEVRVVAFK